VRAALKGLSFELFAGCPDPVATADECDVYAKRLKRVFFLGIPCRGGNYNVKRVRARRRSLGTAALALARLARAFRREAGAAP
jgi:hypothetical protein